MSAGPAKLASRVFAVAGIYGLVTLLPLYFAEPMIAVHTPPSLTHPEYYYGFLGAASVMQLVYLTIARDPVRFRPFMPLAVLAKLSFGVAVAILFAAGRVNDLTMAMASFDLLIGVAFAFVWLRPGEK